MIEKYIIIDVDYEHLTAKILEQTHRYKAFGNGTVNYFKASNDYHLRSFEFPEVCHGSKATYLRGSNNDKDDFLLLFTNLDELNLFVDAVNEYNEKNGNVMQMLKIRKELNAILDIND